MMFEIGDQIVFNPGHESGKEYGFVTGSNEKGFIACRFWSRDNLGSLRNMANSEYCNPRQLEKTGENVPQYIVNSWLLHLGYIFKVKSDVLK